jgi:predicted amidophosphoribosyltransferase
VIGAHASARPPGPLRAGLTELGRLVVPVRCAGCGALDVDLCAGCRRGFAVPRRVEHDAPRLDRMDGRVLPVWACATYDGTVRDVVVQWKDRGRADLGAFLDGVAHRAGRSVGPALAAALGAGARVLVVPVPSSGAAVRARGADLVHALAVAVAGGLGRRGLVPQVASLLRQGGPVRDQVGLASRARAANKADALRVRRAVTAPVLLVDDVVTTGATLASAQAALERAGALVLGGLVLAATPAPGAPRPPRQGRSGCPLGPEEG